MSSKWKKILCGLLCLALLLPLLSADFALWYFWMRGCDTREEMQQAVVGRIWQKSVSNLRELAKAHPEWEVGHIWDGNFRAFEDPEHPVIYVNYLTPRQERLLLEHYDLDPRLRLERAEEKIIEE